MFGVIKQVCFIENSIVFISYKQSSLHVIIGKQVKQNLAPGFGFKNRSRICFETPSMFFPILLYENENVLKLVHASEKFRKS